MVPAGGIRPGNCVWPLDTPAPAMSRKNPGPASGGDENSGTTNLIEPPPQAIQLVLGVGGAGEGFGIDLRESGRELGIHGP